MNKTNNSKVSGNITVEAAFVMPIVMLSIIAFLYLTFYLHDLCKIQNLIDSTLFKASISLKHESDLETGVVNYENIGDRGVLYLILGGDGEEEPIKRYLEQKLRKGLFLSKIENIQIEVTRYQIMISLKINTKVSVPLVKKLFTPYANVIITGKHTIHNPAETLRCMEVVLDTGLKIKGVEELKEKLEGVVD